MEKKDCSFSARILLQPMDNNEFQAQAKSSQNEDAKRLFFGAQTEAPWPKDFPPARIVPEETRHMTLAFLGQNSFVKIEQLFPAIPRPSFRIGPIGISKELIFLPTRNCRVVALSVDWLDADERLNAYQKELAEWLKSHGYSLDKRPFFPHITVARAPFDQQQWKEQFSPLPFFVKGIHLYQSLGNLQYQSLWECPFLPPFEELEHTADIAFVIHGYTVKELHKHAQIALAFKFPQLIDFYSSCLQNSLDEVIISLNEIIAIADTEIGCPFKAVSFHGAVKSGEDNILKWEMIVDV